MGGSALILSTVVFVLLVGLGIFIGLYMRSLNALERYRKIQDVEEYMRECENKAASAKGQCQRLNEDAQKYQEHIAKLKQSIAHYSNVLGKFKTLEEVERKISQQTQELNSLTAIVGQVRTVSEIASQAKYYENYLAQLKADVATVEEARDLQEFGYYQPRYDFDASEQYKTRLDVVLQQHFRFHVASLVNFTIYRQCPAIATL